MTQPREFHAPTAAASVRAVRLVRPLAALAVVAVVFGRALGPAAAGAGMGLDTTIRVLDFGGAAVSQLFAVAAIVTALALMLERAQTSATLIVRVASTGLGAIVVWQALRAPAMRLPDLAALAVGTAAPLLALVVAWDARRVRFAWAVTTTLGLTAIACLLRVAALVWLGAAESGLGEVLVWSRRIATASFAASAVALLVATTWSASRSRKVASPATLSAFALALLATQLVSAASDGSIGVVPVLLERATARLLSPPEPLVPHALRVLLAVAGPLTSAAVLLSPRQIPALSGGLALLLLVQSGSDVPALSLALVVAALGVHLAANDARGFWSAVAPRSGPPAPPVRAGASSPSDGPSGVEPPNDLANRGLVH